VFVLKIIKIVTNFVVKQFKIHVNNSRTSVHTILIIFVSEYKRKFLIHCSLFVARQHSMQIAILFY